MVRYAAFYFGIKYCLIYTDPGLKYAESEPYPVSYWKVLIGLYMLLRLLLIITKSGVTLI